MAPRNHQMPAPKVNSTPINLKTTGVSTFWLHVTGAAVNDPVQVVESGVTTYYWKGKIVSKHTSNPKGSKVQVKYFTGIPPVPVASKKRRSRPTAGPGDIIDITI